jgi:hypothetical protein
MWPERGEALSRTLESEAALADLYAEALNEWAAKTEPLVVPNLDGQVLNGDPALIAASVPPDPDAVTQTSQFWDNLSTEMILAGLSSLWCISLVEAMIGLDIPLPDVPEGAALAVILASVLNAITSTSQVTRQEVIEAVTRVENDPHLKAARDDFVASQRETVAAAPAIMRDKVAAAVRDGGEASVHEGRPDISVVITEQRAAATAVLTPGSPQIRDVARVQGYQAAGVQNAAVITAATQDEDSDTLEKTWIATIDGKTRPTHFAADGQRAPLGGTFTVGGEALRYPGDPTGTPSEIKNCRCRVGVLGQDEALPDEVDRHTERLSGRDSTARNRTGSQADEIARRADDGTIRARDDEDGIGRTAGAAPSEQEYDMTTAEKLTADGTADPAETYRTFTDQPIAFTGIETSDGRMLASDIDLSFRTPPMPVMWTKQTGSGHEDAYTVGVMESARLENGQVLASGYMLNTPEASEAAGQLQHTATRPSVDLAAVSYILTVDGKEITEDDWYDLPFDADIVQTMTAAELIGVTLVATPAFGDTKLSLNADSETREPALVASAAEAFRPRVYAAALFSDPGLTEPTLPTMDEDTGRIFGHLACFGACHRSIQAKCTMAPRSPSAYAHFHTSPAVRLDNGERLPVGRLTVGTGHASEQVGSSVAVAHYDNSGACFALVRVGEDSHGIWFSGVAAPWATAEQIEEGLSAPLSGDWRNMDGRGLDLIAALAVNTPGFAVRGRSDNIGRPAALVASLGPAPARVVRSNQHLTAQDIGVIVEKAVGRAIMGVEIDNEMSALIQEAAAEFGPMPTPDEELAALLAEAETELATPVPCAPAKGMPAKGKKKPKVKA